MASASRAGSVKAPYLTGGQQADLDPAIFGEPFHGSLVHEAVRAELAARRRGSASTKTRGEIAMTGAKEWRQKGTGRARVGALSTPQRVGGGVAFGPKPRSYTVKVNRKARRRALRSALSVHAERESLAVVDPSEFESPSTRKAAEAIEAGGGKGTLVVLSLAARAGEEGSPGEEACAKSFRNLTGVRVMPVDTVGVADVVGARRLLATPSALERLVQLASPPIGRRDRQADSASTEEVAS